MPSPNPQQSVLDILQRLWTPGVQGLTPTPQDDPFYQRAIGGVINPAPQALQPGVGYAQQMATNYGDASTLGSTIGMKPQKAEKIRKAKKGQ
jgi:hypothetical protein